MEIFHAKTFCRHVRRQGWLGSSQSFCLQALLSVLLNHPVWPNFYSSEGIHQSQPAVLYYGDPRSRYDPLLYSELTTTSEEQGRRTAEISPGYE